MADALIEVVQHDRLLTVTELAVELGVTARAIRFYEDKGLIQPGRAGATRVYTYREHARMQLILRGKRLGFSLREIKEFLDLYDVDPEHDEQKRLLLRAVRDRIKQLRAMSAALTRTLDELQAIELQVSSALER
ncbi:MAG: MerR family transcriptional regulator [Janthinobacterium lividum]